MIPLNKPVISLDKAQKIISICYRKIIDRNSKGNQERLVALDSKTTTLSQHSLKKQLL
jgi:hypothetical protein